MSESPRWERESHEDLTAPASPQPQDTVEMDAASDQLVDPGELSDPPEYDDGADREEGAERFLAARESLSATREAARESLAASRENARASLVATGASARESLSATRESARESLSATRESLSATADSLAVTGRRVGQWLSSLDRRPEFDIHHRRDPVAELTAGPPGPDDDAAADATARFPIALRGYEREAVDRHLAELESELSRLREQVEPPLSITEEIERLGEQTASILVVAHDKAHETARKAQEQAARAVSEAADDAERITTAAQRRLRELDEETDAVWRERARLLDDVREVSATLATLADAAVDRFPAAEPGEPAEPLDLPA